MGWGQAFDVRFQLLVFELVVSWPFSMFFGGFFVLVGVRWLAGF